METLSLSDQTARYRAIIRAFVQADAQATQPSHGDIQSIAVCDENTDNYLLIYVGWSGYERADDLIMHVRIRDGQVWIEHDGTHEGISPALVAAGIPPQAIILGFLHPSERDVAVPA